MKNGKSSQASTSINSCTELWVSFLLKNCKTTSLVLNIAASLDIFDLV